MLVDLTPNLEEIERRTQISVEHNFEYIPQHDEKLKGGVGIYRPWCDFNFAHDEFIEKLDSNINRHLFEQKFILDVFHEKYISSNGVADNIEQILEYYKKQIDDTENKYIISVTPVFQELENKNKGGGWRWHKWGQYIGKLDKKCEYLDDEEFGEDFKYVICFRIYKVIE